MFGGGPLPVKVGNQLWAAGIQLASGYGGTEFGIIVPTPHRKDIGDGAWMWMHFREEQKVKWVPQGDETFELHILV